MDFDYRQRAQWQTANQPITGPAKKAKTTTAVAHYTSSMSASPSGEAAVQFLRNMQADYLRSRGYSVGYWAYVDQSGVAWQIRGAHPNDLQDFNAAANPGRNVAGNANDWTAPILFGHGRNEPISAEAAATAIKLWRWWGLTGRPVPHSHLDPTGCCGDAARNQISAGFLDINPAPRPTPIIEPSEEDDMSQSFMWRHAKYASTKPGLFWVCNGSVCHLDGRLRDALLDAGVRVITSSNDGVYESMLHAINRPDGF